MRGYECDAQMCVVILKNKSNVGLSKISVEYSVPQALKADIKL